MKLLAIKTVKSKTVPKQKGKRFQNAEIRPGPQPLQEGYM